MSRYHVYITPNAFQEVKRLPGNVRQRIKGAIRALGDNPRPPQSKALDVPDTEQELLRVRMDSWRIVYLVSEANKTVDVLAVRRRPPYDYADLESLLDEEGD